MAYPKGFEGQYGAQPDRPGTEHDDLVRRLGFALVGAVAGDGHRLVERGDFPRDVAGNDFETGSAHGVFDQQVIRERPGRSPVADDAARRGHRIDHDVIPDRDAGHLIADLDDFAGRLVPQRRVSLARRDAADRDVERVGTADAAGTHPDEDVVATGLWAVGVDDLCLTRSGDDGHFHGAASSSMSKVSRYSAKTGSSCSTLRPYWSRLYELSANRSCGCAASQLRMRASASGVSGSPAHS